MDLIDKISGEAQQVASGALRLGVSTAGRLVKLSVRMAVGTGQQSVRALAGLVTAAKDAAASKREQGQVGLRQFTRLVDSKREVVGIKDSEVARQLARELRRHGVLFSVETHGDGTRSFHVQGKDAALIEHALTVASTRVDERLASKDTALTVAEPGQAAERVLTLSAVQRDALVNELDTAQLKDLATQVRQDSAITLTRDNVEAIDRVLTHKGWQVSSLEETPEQLREVVIAVDEERVNFETQSLDDAPVQAHDRVEDAPAATVDPEQTPAQETVTRTAAQAERTTSTSKQTAPAMNRRDATRKRIGDRIERSVAAKKQEIAQTSTITRERPHNLGRK